MLKTLARAGVFAAVALTGYSQQASATVYVNSRVCGGTTFATCAAIHLDVTGTTVTLRLWNLGGNFGATGINSSANTIFNGIGLYNVPPAVDVMANPGSQLATSGPARAGNTPGNWRLRQNQQVGFMIDFGAVSTGLNNGIASGCANAASLPSAAGTGPELYMNPCANGGSLADYVTFTFQVTQNWDATNTYFTVRGVDALTGQVSECHTGPDLAGNQANCLPVQVVPEPMTMALLATGLVGLGGVGFIRRRKIQA